MPWDDTARKQHSRDGLRYPSDLTDREWALLEPLLPPAKRGGRPRTTDLRAVTDAMLYISISEAANRRCCQRTSRRFRPSGVISTLGAMPACGRRSTICWS